MSRMLLHLWIQKLSITMTEFSCRKGFIWSRKPSMNPANVTVLNEPSRISTYKMLSNKSAGSIEYLVFQVVRYTHCTQKMHSVPLTAFHGQRRPSVQHAVQRQPRHGHGKLCVDHMHSVMRWLLPLELRNSGQELGCERFLDISFSLCAAPTFYRSPDILYTTRVLGSWVS